MQLTLLVYSAANYHWEKKIATLIILQNLINGVI